MNAGALAIFMIFSIPIIAILVGGWKAYLEFKSEQRQLGSSTDALERQLETLRDRVDTVAAERDALRKRVENLETIVTAEAWDAVQTAQDADAEALPEAADLDLLDRNSAAETPASEEIEALARRLRNR